MELHEGFRQGTVSRDMVTQKGAEPKCPMCRCLLLHGNADMEGVLAASLQRGEPLSKASRTCEQIDNAESGWQIIDLSNSDHWLYTRSIGRGQEANDRHR